MHRPIHFEILVDDPKDNAEFYTEVFGWKINSWGDGEQSYLLATTGEEGTPGINGAFMATNFKQKVINTLDAESLEETIRKIEQAGGMLVHGPTEVPGEGIHAYFTDRSGVLFGVMQPAMQEE